MSCIHTFRMTQASLMIMCTLALVGCTALPDDSPAEVDRSLEAETSDWAQIEQEVQTCSDERVVVACGRSGQGLVCSRWGYPSTPPTKGMTPRFLKGNLVIPQMSDANYWGSPKYALTIQYPDINGDGDADMCARSSNGIVCADGNGDGTFSNYGLRLPYFTDAQNWDDDPSVWATIQFGDLNADGFDDVCGRTFNHGVRCALADGNGGFHNPTLWLDDAKNGDGFNDTSSWSTMRLVHLNRDDDKIDICIRRTPKHANYGQGWFRVGGLSCATSTGTYFHKDVKSWPTTPSSPTIPAGMSHLTGVLETYDRDHPELFGYYTDWANGGGMEDLWATAPKYGTIHFANVRNSSADYNYIRTVFYGPRNDACGLSEEGIVCAERVHRDTARVTFGHRQVYTTHFNLNDPNAGWDRPSQWGTLHFPDVNGDGLADVCGRSRNGIDCQVSNDAYHNPRFVNVHGPGSHQWTTVFSDATGWGQSAHNWSTITYFDVDGDGRDDVCGRSNNGLVCALSQGDTFGLPLGPASPHDNFSNVNGWHHSQTRWGTIRIFEARRDGVCDSGKGNLPWGTSAVHPRN